MNRRDGHKNPLLLLPRVRAIGFDLDGTLFSRASAFATLMRDWLEDCPDPPSLCEIIKRDADGYSPRLQFFSWLNQQVGLESSAEALWGRFRHELPAGIKPSPALAAGLQSLRRLDYSLGLLSNGSADLQMAKLEALGLTNCFHPDHILVSGMIGVEKPHREAFSALQCALAVPAPEILFIGDHWENDIRGASEAGLQACWLARGRRPPAEGGGIFVVDELGDLFA